jgi:transcriptional regulator with XRE-family HTH domain
MNNELKSHHLLYWRKRRNVSLRDLAARIVTSGNQFVSPNTLNRWEKGETPLPDWAISELSKALKISDVELIHGPREADPALPVNVSAAYTGMDLEIAEHIINMGFTSWIASHPDEARQAVETIMPWLEAALRRAPLSTHAKQGKHILARGHELLGALALDQLDNNGAITEFRHALTLSEELGDTSLIVAHTTELGDAHRRKGDKETGLAMMQGALAISNSVQRSLQGYVLEMIAYTYADTGNEKAFHYHIEEAVDLLGHSGEGEGAAKRDFIPFEVLEIYGKALRDFGHPVQALEYINRAERTLINRPNVPRWQALITITKAQALCDAGELEEGIALAIRGITLAHSCRSPRQMNRVRKLMIKLCNSEHKEEPILIPLREIVSDIYVGNRSPLDWRPQHAM